MLHGKGAFFWLIPSCMINDAGRNIFQACDANQLYSECRHKTITIS